MVVAGCNDECGCIWSVWCAEPSEYGGSEKMFSTNGRKDKLGKDEVSTRET